MNKYFEILINSASGAFLQVGVFVGAVLFIFGYINFKTQGRFVEKLRKAKKYQPLIGAFLGLTPGCGGAIFVMPLYLKGQVSYGTVIAALLATMGDAAFVLITTDIRAWFLVSVVCFVIGTITGYIVDYFGICAVKKYDERDIDNIEHEKSKGKINNNFIHKITHNYVYKIYWILIIIGLVLGIILLCQVDIDTQLLIPNIGMIIGISGTLLSIIYNIIEKKLIVNDTFSEEEEKIFSLKRTLIHNAEETAFVIQWVFAAYFVYEVLLLLIGGEAVIQNLMMQKAIFAVILGAVIGLIPGCGPQIILATLFSRGLIPFSALIANAISQDGDALFPLLIVNKKSSIIATVITTIPAVIIGLLWYLLGLG